MTKVYVSKVDGWLIAINLLFLVGPAIFTNISGTFSITLLIVCIALALAIVWMLFNIRYTLQDDLLIIRSFPFYNTKIPISTIRKINHSKSFISSPAASLNRLEIVYNKFDSILISPSEQEAFIQDLKQLNPSIVVK